MAETKCKKCGVTIASGWLCDRCKRQIKGWGKKVAGVVGTAGVLVIAVISKGKIKLK